MHSVYLRIIARGTVNIYTFTPESALGTMVSAGVLFLIIRFFIGYWQKQPYFSTKEMLKIFAFSLVMYVLIMQATGLLIALIFDNVERNFNRETLTLSTLTHFLKGFIYGSFFLAYYFYKRNRKYRQQLTMYNQALSESRINQLKTQLNPHFLFNNLNVLDQLIEEDKNKASEFLNEFAEIYRYVLQATDQNLVELEEELSFAKKYFDLVQYKYGKSYQLEIIQKEKTEGYVIPLSMQLLLENAIQHNLGTENNPVFIKMEITDKLVVSNNSIEKRNLKRTSGRALNNLKEQYALLSDRKIEIFKSEELFSITLPLIRKEND